MVELVRQIIDFYMKNLRTPSIEDLNIENRALLNEKGMYFVTLYYKGEIRGGAGNVKELKNTGAEELIENVIVALTGDKRFSPLTLNEAPETKIRVDKIIKRDLLKDKKINSLDPTKTGLIVIKKDYSKLATILPNINAKLFAGEDFIPVLLEKLGEKKWNENDYIIYEIETETETDY